MCIKDYFLFTNYIATITPTHGSMLGGTVLVIDRLSSTTRITCMFDDSIAVNGTMVSTSIAICISPRLDKSGPVQLSVLIDDEQIKTNSEIFYSRKSIVMIRIIMIIALFKSSQSTILT